MQKKKEGPILVAIKCAVYNHEPYLRDCLEGFVMQQTNFPFVAIVHDDASIDNSAAIIREYEAKYPDIIKPIYETENLYSKGDGSVDRIMNAAIEATGAKYIAMCEGDDYWTDPLKLQKQVDFMEANPEYSMCFHKVNTLIQKTGEIKNEFIVRDMPGKSTILDLAEGNYIHTPSVLYRRYSGVQEQYQKMMPCLPGDYVIWMLLAERGDIYKFDEPMAVYRYGSGIWSTDESVRPDLEMLMTLNKLWVAIDNDEVRKVLQEQILKQKQTVLDFVAHLQHDLYVVRSSKAYRLGKMLLKPFKWLKKNEK
ncbi:MAG: glycosyltransferase family A protein [Paludibacteraceae bacterium]|nr:glycosyltransferase family A protein [Paludibacteraceae bacterium]